MKKTFLCVLYLISKSPRPYTDDFPGFLCEVETVMKKSNVRFKTKSGGDMSKALDALVSLVLVWGDQMQCFIILDGSHVVSVDRPLTQISGA